MEPVEQRVLILNSAQSKYPLGSDPWIQVTVHAVEALSARNITIITGIEPLTWDMVTALTEINRIKIMLLVPAGDDRDGHSVLDSIMKSFSLDNALVQARFLGTLSHGQRKTSWRNRDIAAFEIADMIIPVSIRPGGKLDTLLSDQRFSEKVRRDFAIPWQKTSRDGRIPSYDFSGKSFNPFPQGEWLIHWTRTSPGPWPGEKASDFFRDMLARPDMYVRSARETLIRLVCDAAIMGTSWKMPGGVESVSFTSLPLEESISLMRWRKRFVRYSFEPYGIAVRREALRDLGAHEVSYTDTKSSEHQNALFIQSPGEQGDWRAEHEWRLAGDLDLGALAEKDYFAIVPDRSEEEEISELLNHRGSLIHPIFR